MGKKKRDTPITGSVWRDNELGATYFPFLGPSPIDTADTSFCGPGRPTYHAPASAAVCTDHRGGVNRRETESLHSSNSEIAEDNVINMPIGSRPFRESQSLVLVAPPYSTLYSPGFAQLAPPMPAPWLRSSPPDGHVFIKRKTSPHQHMQHLGLKCVTISMAGLFLIAFIAVIFTAVYFGQKLNTHPKV